MNDLLSITAEKIHDVLQKKGSIPLSHLESTINVSFNLLFLAIDRLSTERKIWIRRTDMDYIIVSPGDRIEEK